ncbi:NAD(P)H-dependent oxidoreductase [Bdellovibrio sp. HCB2-146]|uniref:NAD(P)H-dependent oxidoreductase n=1 Tax=Bdellovibrio sp. HCB2-146 TaxID=3394362 RepID=UPI0039BC8BB1
MKKVLVINGHPNDESLNAHLALQYSEGAKQAGHEVKLVHLSHLKFDPILHKGYLKIQELEPDLIQAQKDILWAEHVVFVYPMWWGTVPALLKGFLDRTFLPGFAFKYRKDNPLWDRLLKGRSGRIILTTDAPWWWNLFVNWNPSIRMMKVTVLEFCGIKPVGVTQFDSVKTRRPHEIQKYLKKTFELGQRAI